MRHTVWGVLLAIVLVLAALPGAVFGSDARTPDVQFEKERALAETLKALLTCKNMRAYEDGDLYCVLTFRGLKVEFAGVNAKDGRAIYVTGMGQNQTLSSRGSRCLLIAFGDQDLRGIIAAHILLRDDGTITHNTNNRKAWAECR